jgi:hypothetical protein
MECFISAYIGGSIVILFFWSTSLKELGGKERAIFARAMFVWPLYIAVYTVYRTIDSIRRIKNGEKNER